MRLCRQTRLSLALTTSFIFCPQGSCDVGLPAGFAPPYIQPQHRGKHLKASLNSLILSFSFPSVTICHPTMVFFYCVSFSQGCFGPPSPPLSSYQHLVALLVGQRHPLLVHPSTCDTRDGFISDASVLRGFPPSLSTCPTTPQPCSRCLSLPL